MKYIKARTISVTLMVAVMFIFFTATLIAPRTANARPGYLDAVIRIDYPDSAQAYQCANCHTNWSGNGLGYSSRIDYVIYNGLTYSAIPSTNPMYLMDSDQDGRTNLEEIQASRLAGTARPAQFATGVSTGPNVANNWNWQIPDKDGDGCSHYLSRFTEAGTYPTTSGVAAAAIVGTGTTYNNYKRFNPRGWDMDDNDAAQGCNPTAWTDTAIDVTSGTSTDTLPPGAVNTLSGAAIGSAIIPLKWNAVGDDGNGVPGGTAGGPAHSYELRYTTSAFANGTVGRNPRSPADWQIMHNIAEPAEIDGTGGTWSGGTAALMQALYEPRPDVPGNFQPCNARNGAGTMTCTAGASYDIKSRGTNLAVNTIVNGTTYWVALWTHDGVSRITGTLTTPGTVTEQATLSNIIAVTAGPAGTGAAISSISPTLLSGAASSITVTVSGFGLNSTQAAQMVLTNSAGTAVATATGLSYSASAVTGSFASPIADGIYNLELRTSGAVTKAAWVNAVTVSGFFVGDPFPTVSAVSPNTRGQGAQNQCIQISGTNFYPPISVNFSFAGITVNSVTVNSPTSLTVCVSIAPATASGTGTVSVNANGFASNTVPFTVTAAPTHNCVPPGGTASVAYNYSCTGSGGVPPYSWVVTSLPAGMSSSVSGANNEILTISGTPIQNGTFIGSIRITDVNAGTFTTSHSIFIASSEPGATRPMVVAGAYHSVALKPDGTVQTWGRNNWGQLGDGTKTNRSGWVSVPGLTGIVSVAAGFDHSVALKSDGTVMVWGYNAKGQLGDGTTVNRLTPVAVSGLTGVIAVAAGEYHTLALKSDGTVVAWGWNAYGQLGDGTTWDRLSPVAVPGLTGVTAVTAGQYSSMALKSDGTLMGWGSNGFRQLGDDMTHRSSPVAVPGVTGVAAVAMGWGHTVALKTDSTVMTWGGNRSGQLGDGTTAEVRSTPMAVPGLTGVATVRAGGNHTVAVKLDGTVVAWGANSLGQLGDGTTLGRLSPVAVAGLTGVVTAAVGGFHTVALKGDDTIMAWGYNFYGQVGDRTVINRLSPVAVLVSGGAELPALSYSAEAGYGTSGVSPATGSTSTVLTYKVVYTHPSNTEPTSILVCIDALPCSYMDRDRHIAPEMSDGSYANGEQFVYSTSLAAGAHTYYFTASDGTATSSLPASGSLSGPTISSLAISSSVLTNGAVGSAYSETLAATGGTAPYTWASNSLPTGLSLNPTGVISGTPTTEGMFSFSVTVTDAASAVIQKAVSITIQPDSVVPTVPTRLITAKAFSATQIDLTWDASTDNVGVTGYKVYRNGVQVGAPSGTSYSDTGLAAATSYTYTAAACDAAGNCSEQSSAVTGTTKKK